MPGGDGPCPAGGKACVPGVGLLARARKACVPGVGLLARARKACVPGVGLLARAGKACVPGVGLLARAGKALGGPAGRCRVVTGRAMSGSNLPAMAPSSLSRLRVGWWAGAEPSSPLSALSGSLLRAEMVARCPGLSPVLVYGAPASWLEAGFTGEPVEIQLASDWAGQQSTPLDILVCSGGPEPGGPKTSQALAEAGTASVAIAAEDGWGLEPTSSVGPPFGVPEPALLAARHLGRSTLEARRAYLRVVEGLPRCYVLVEGSLLDPPTGGAPERGDLELALRRLAASAGSGRPAEVVRLAPGPLTQEDPAVESVLHERRAEAEEGRHLAEDWPGYPDRSRLALRVTSPLDLAAAVAGAEVVVAASGAMMALAWSLGAPHVALAPEGSTASNFAAWTGDASALAEDTVDLLATIDNIFARRGSPPGLKRLEATLDQSLDEAASNLERKATEVADSARGGPASEVVWRERAHELEAVNDALRLRLAAERLRFGERAALLEKAANTSVESAIKAVHGQDVIVRRRLEQTETEMRRLQEETALQQAELKAIYASWTMKAMAPARQWYGRLRGASR
jgi:hypothetical protein